MKKYYVYKPCRYAGETASDYWRGSFTKSKIPSVTKHTRKAAGFDTAREAYDAAGRDERLAWWKVGKREVA
jgi:hypothetical protein